MNYTVNHGRRLTNSDSATYCCTWKSLRPEYVYSYIDVNVHGKFMLWMELWYITYCKAYVAFTSLDDPWVHLLLYKIVYHFVFLCE